jgi:CheY-like chemotaxis protein
MTRRVLPARLRIEAPTEVPAVTLRLDRDAIEQALLNLVLNARDAIPGEGTIRLTVETTDDGPRAGIAISCTDDGPGMPPDVLARATEPFFTTKGSDAGTGLGLSVVYSIMERHGGRLDLASAPGEGTRATLWFPLPTGEAMPAQVDRSAPVPAASAHSSAPRILLVEDEHPVRVATERALQRFGWRVASVSSAAEAERILAGDAVVDLVVSDIMMPGGTGIDLLRAVRATGCTVPFLFVSGYQVDSLEGVLDADERAALLPKPWSAAELREKVAGMLTPPGGRPAVRGPAAPAR